MYNLGFLSGIFGIAVAIIAALTVWWSIKEVIGRLYHGYEKATIDIQKNNPIQDKTGKRLGITTAVGVDENESRQDRTFDFWDEVERGEVKSKKES